MTLKTRTEELGQACLLQRLEEVEDGLDECRNLGGMEAFFGGSFIEGLVMARQVVN
jgi:hypothetical protein